MSIQGYIISLEMKQAKYKVMPWSKLKVFNTNKNKLEELILKNVDFQSESLTGTQTNTFCS